MISIVIRCDASFSIGSGHVMRCRTLARELRRRGADVTFLCRRQPGDLISLLEEEFPVLALPEQLLTACDGLEGRQLYAAWLGCSQDQDAAQCLEKIRQAAITDICWLVVDHYGLDVTWETQLLEDSLFQMNTKILVIDDLADRLHQADILLDQNFFGEETEKRYQELVSTCCCQLVGPHYAQLSTEYSQLHPLVPTRTELRRVLVYFGGVDSANLTAMAIRALMSPDFSHLAVDVVLGIQNMNRDLVQELVANRPYTTLYDPLPSLAGLIARADLVIGAAGSSNWERISLGLPSLVVTVGNDQLPIAKALHKAQYVHFLCNSSSVTEKKIHNALLEYINQMPIQSNISFLSDGWGCSRLAIAMLGLNDQIVLRPAIISDENLFLRWANDPAVRLNSFSPNMIKKLEHSKWFKSKLNCSHTLLLIAMDSSGCPIGQIRFDLNSSTSQPSASIDFSLDRCARGKGYARKLLMQGIEFANNKWENNIDFLADVLHQNKASNSVFENSGFSVDAELTLERFGQSFNFTRWILRSININAI